MSETKTYDYIIVGAGSAGCVLANRLTDDPDVSVLLLEAGKRDRDPLIHVPLGVGKMFPNRMYDWDYDTEPEPNLDNRTIECARGKVLGGSSSTNAMAYVRGNRGDYDRWQRGGCDGWSYADVVPYFKRTESWAGGADDYRGADGPLTVCRQNQDDPLYSAFIEAGKQAGYDYIEDYNGAQQAGFSPCQSNIRNGRRCSAAVAFLRPAIKRANLTVEIGALVTRLIVEHGRATGIDYRRSGHTRHARVGREMILSGGVINTPQLLMLSGIGPADHLNDIGIEPIHDLPGVGKNLQDHLTIGVYCKRPRPGPLVELLRYDRLVFSMHPANLFGTGPATSLPIGPMAFLKSRPDLDIPDIQFLFQAAPMVSAPWFPGGRRNWADGFQCRSVLVRPESRGEVRLRSADPADKMRIQPNFLSTDNDVRTIREGVKMTRNVLSQLALSDFVEAEIVPGPDVKTDDGIDAFVRASGATAHHPLGTCRMGTDELAVVDPELRLRGLDAVRVVDASVMPDLVCGNIQAPVFMIAEKAADLIRGRVALPRAEV